MTEAEKLFKENRDYTKQKQREVDDLFKYAEQGDPDAEKWIRYGVRCFHQLSQPGEKTCMVYREYQRRHPRELTHQEKILKERHIRDMLRTADNPDGDPTIAKLQNSGYLARHSSEWVWTPDRVYRHLCKTVSEDYAHIWADSYMEEKARADKNGWEVEVHPSGSIIIHKNRK